MAATPPTPKREPLPPAKPAYIITEPTPLPPKRPPTVRLPRFPEADPTRRQEPSPKRRNNG